MGDHATCASETRLKESGCGGDHLLAAILYYVRAGNRGREVGINTAESVRAKGVGDHEDGREEREKQMGGTIGKSVNQILPLQRNVRGPTCGRTESLTVQARKRSPRGSSRHPGHADWHIERRFAVEPIK